MERWKALMAKVEREHGIVTRDDLHAGGLSPRQVARWTDDGRLVPMAYGVFRLGGVPPSFEAEVLAAVKVFPDETWASHHTAARLWGIGVAGREPRIELTRPTLLSGQRSVARIHRSTTLGPHHLTSLRGIPVTTPARTLFDLARTTGPTRLGRAVTRATRDDLCTVGSLYRVLFDLGGRGRPGTRRMRQVLDEKGIEYVPTESELDDIGRALLGDISGLAWQVEMSDEQGYIRRVDGLHQAARVVVEFDGAAFHEHDPEQVALDGAGDARLGAMGYRVERLRWADVTRHAEATRTRVGRLVTAAAA